MRAVPLSLALWLVGLTAPAVAQCPAPLGAYRGPAPTSAYFGGQTGQAGYAPYDALSGPYAPFNARAPSYPLWSNTTPRYGVRSTYFRGQPGLAPPGGTFFGGYDYQVTYPPGWFGGYWTKW